MFFLLTLNANSLQKTSIQLMWLDQFEFAGFYVAKEKGFYQELGLDVEIKKFDANINLTNEVLDGKSDFPSKTSFVKFIEELNFLISTSRPNS